MHGTTSLKFKNRPVAVIVYASLINVKLKIEEIWKGIMKTTGIASYAFYARTFLDI